MKLSVFLSSALALLACLSLVEGTNYVDPLDSCEDSIDGEVDRAKIFYSNADGYALYVTNSLCHKCSRTLAAPGLADGSNSCASMFTPHMWKLYIVDPNDPDVVLSKTTYTFGDEGEYQITTDPNNNFEISVKETNSPTNSMLPLYILFGVLGFVIICAFGLPVLREKLYPSQKKPRGDSKSQHRTVGGGLFTGAETMKYSAVPLIEENNEASEINPEDGNKSREHLHSHGSMEEVHLTSPAASSPHASVTGPSGAAAGLAAPPLGKKPERLQSLDTFRGISLCLMIFVNYGGGGYWFFEHAAWNGLTVADLLFPWFMWIMGVSMALSFVSILKNQPRGAGGSSITSAALSRIKGFGSSTPTGEDAYGTSNPVSHAFPSSAAVSTSVTSGHDLAAMNPRGRSATGMSSNPSGGTGFDRSMRNSASTLNESHNSGLNSVRSISTASNVSVHALNAATSINSHTSNPLPDYVPTGSQASASNGANVNEVRDALGENTLMNSGATEETSPLPLTLCGIDLVIWKRVTRRSIILFLIGMFLANGWEYSTWRIPGVLQYFGFSYFITACTILSVHSITKQRLAKLEREYGFTRHSQAGDDQSNFRKMASSLMARAKILTAYYYEWLIQAAIIVIYLSIAYGGKVDGCPRGYIGPGGISDHSENYFCTGGMHRYIDMKFFTWQLIYHHPTCLDLYQCRVYDPEGLLGSLSACTLTYLGLMAGRIVLHFPEHNKRMAMWCICGCVLMLIAGILCGFSREDGFIPINKNLWSTSFVAVTSGGGMVVLSLCYLLIDKWKVWSGAPFRALGMNSILIYCGHSLLADYMPFSYKIYHVNHGTLLQCHVLGTLSWVIVAAYCYHIKFFVKV